MFTMKCDIAYSNVTKQNLLSFHDFKLTSDLKHLE